ncbi:hypothetical protein FRC02_005407 [Tulasnella sp. 418]|nr:hypothetical protein FRC02_005407 [Tulasnella sp. 418]
MSSSHVVDITALDQKQFTSLVSKASKSAQADVVAVWSSLATIYGRVGSQKIQFLPSAHAVVAPGAFPSPETVTFLGGLTDAAHNSATSLLCTSILAGQGSESDEYGDVGIVLGLPHTIESGTEAGAESAINQLGLESWLTGAELVILNNDGSQVPASLKGVSTHQLQSAKANIDNLQSHLSTLRDVFEFRLVPGGVGGLVIHFLLGHNGHNWLGLMGASTWGDY